MNSNRGNHLENQTAEAAPFHPAKLHFEIEFSKSQEISAPKKFKKIKMQIRCSGFKSSSGFEKAIKKSTDRRVLVGRPRIRLGLTSEPLIQRRPPDVSCQTGISKKFGRTALITNCIT